MFIGIDVGLKHLDLAATPAAPALPRRVPNTPEGIAQVVPLLHTLTPALIVLEATGTYHQPLLLQAQVVIREDRIIKHQQWLSNREQESLALRRGRRV